MRTLAILFVAAAVGVWWTGDRAALSAQPAAGGASASGAAQGQATSGNNEPTDLNNNNPAGLNPMQQSNPAGSNPANSTQNAADNPPGSNKPATGSGAFNHPGTGATINTPRGQIDIGANANAGLNVDVNRNATGNLPNAQMRQDLQEDRQNFRQDLRNERRENRLERQSNLNDPNRWRFVLQNGEWWYWLPNNTWTYWRDNRWMPYDADNFQPYGYRVGYRGIGNGSTTFYFDENGLRFRRDYSPGRPQNSEMQMHEPPKSMQESNSIEKSN